MSETAYPKVYLYRRVVQAKLFIDGHFAEKIEIDRIADEAFFSRFHFIRLFKKIYSTTPHQYLTQVRMEQAKLLLINGTSATETCFAVGFDSLPSFTALFKKSTGVTPAVFRQQQEERRAQLSGKPLHFIPGCFAEHNGWTKKQF